MHVAKGNCHQVREKRQAEGQKGQNIMIDKIALKFSLWAVQPKLHPAENFITRDKHVYTSCAGLGN